MLSSAIALPVRKLIEGVLAAEDDPEFGISRGRLMPTHRILESQEAPAEMRHKSSRVTTVSGEISPPHAVITSAPGAPLGGAVVTVRLPTGTLSSSHSNL